MVAIVMTSNTKHADQQCKVCSQKFSSPIELWHHIAKEHRSNIKINVNNTEGQDESLMKTEVIYSE